MQTMVPPHPPHHASPGGSRFTDVLLRSSSELFERAVNHRLMRGLGGSDLPLDVFKRYLVQESAFVETAAIVTAYALTRAPDMVDKARLARTLTDLTTTQADYFRTAFRTLDVDPSKAYSVELPTAAQAFADFAVRTAATDTYPAILTLILAAEWLYATWCSRADAAPHAQPDYAAWIAIHTSPAFVSYVEWLRDRLDALAPTMTDAARRHLSGIFERVLRHEIAFHDAPFDRASGD